MTRKELIEAIVEAFDQNKRQLIDVRKMKLKPHWSQKKTFDPAKRQLLKAIKRK